MDKYQKFEHTLPFYRIHIDDFEGRVKRFVQNKQTVSLRQLCFAFKDLSSWEDLQNDDSTLVKILKSSHFEENGEIDISKLLLWGILLCAGDIQEKTRAFYDILQD